MALLAEAVLEKGVPFRLHVTGYSMYPFIRDGDILTVAPISFADAKIGQVLAGRVPRTQKLIIHRCIGRDGESIRLKGDNLRLSDPPMRAPDVLGCIRRMERGGKTMAFGIGPEGRLIALLSGMNLLWPIRFAWGKLLSVNPTFSS